ncbi:GNAT family N-acetyltransferase [Paucibacter sp. JuS9]|uniref:GNAT family N-acetyltransferase n=1 Tax=Roseateles TaxID=93681 RepID=UPI002FE68107
MPLLTTARLRLEPCSDAHLAGLHKLNSDPLVMRYITGKPDTLADTQDMIDRVKARWAEFGYSWWSFVELSGGEIIGAGCVQHLNRDPAGPLETGWRLRQDRWGKGFASEAAHAMGTFAFETLNAPLLCAVCMVENTPSSTVMQRMGMQFRRMGHFYERDMAYYDMSAADWAARKAAGQSPPTK